MNLATTWLGKSTTTEILGFFGFTKSFCDELEERMRGEGKGLVIGSKVRIELGAKGGRSKRRLEPE